MEKRCFIILLVILVLGHAQNGRMVLAKDSGEEVNDMEEKPDRVAEDPLGFFDYGELLEVENSLRDMTGFSDFSFIDLIKGLVRGEVPFEKDAVLKKVKEILIGQLLSQKDLILQILLISVLSAVCSNFIHIFQNRQIADIGYYMMYLLISTLLLRSFSSMASIAAAALQNLSRFVQILLPPYLITIVFSSGSISAAGFYQITVVAVTLLQTAVGRLILPAIQLNMILMILNQLAGGDYFSGFAELLETGIDWGLKTVFGIIVGLQAVQCLVSPAVDALKNSAVHRAAKALPGIGNALDAAAETVAGSAMVLKNAVGAAGMIAILAVCLIPFLKLAVNVILFRLLYALIQPVSDKKIIGCVKSVSESGTMLMRTMFAGVSIFLVSLAMITASVRGG